MTDDAGRSWSDGPSLPAEPLPVSAAALPADPIAAMLDDPPMLAALRAIYRGPHDVMDALWWRLHPLTRGPSGTPDPGIALAALRHEAYSRRGSEAPLVAMVDETSGRTVLVRSSEFALHEAERRQQLDAASLASAVESVMRAQSDRPRQESTVRDPPIEGATGDSSAMFDGSGEGGSELIGIDGPRAAGRVRTRRRTRKWCVAALVIVAIAAGAFAAGRMSFQHVASPTPVPSSSLGLFSAGQHGSATIALLQSPQTPSDVPPFAFDSAIIPGSIHVFAAVQSRGATVYGALTKTGLLCLVAVTVDLHSAQTCATQHVFVTDGIRLRITTNTPVATATGASDFAYFQYLWTSDGSIVGSSNEYFVTE